MNAMRGIALGGVMVVLLITVLAPAPSRASMKPFNTEKPIDTRLLRQAEIRYPSQLAKIDPADMGYFVRAWITAGRRDRAKRYVRDLRRRGMAAFRPITVTPPFPGDPPYPPDTLFSFETVQVAEAFRLARVSFALPLQVLLTRFAFVNGCFSYDDQRSDRGCVHNVNALALGFLSHLGTTGPTADLYRSALDYERRTILPNGAWWYWEDAPPQSKAVNPLAYQAFQVWWLMTSPDPSVRSLGRQGAKFVRASWTPDMSKLSPEDRAISWLPIAALIAAGDRKLCNWVPKMPVWQLRFSAANPDSGFFYAWSQKRCGRRPAK
jgi:hypothetical protein